MRFSEELLLLLHSDDTGYFVPVPEWNMSCALAGGVLLDLSLEGRIDSDLESLILVDPTPTGDPLLDPTLAEIARDETVRTPRFWVERIAQRSDKISDESMNRLVNAGIFEADSGGFLSLSKKVTRTGRYPLVDGRTGEEIKGRIFRSLFDGEIPEPRDVAIIALVHSCGGFRAILDPDEFDEAKDLIELYAGMDLIARGIAVAIRSSYRPPSSMRSGRRRPMPEVGMWEMLSSKAFRSRNVPKFLAETFKELGPVYKLKFPGRELVVLVGTDVNKWAAKKGRHHLRTRDYLQGFQAEWGTARSVASLDGADHFRMRRAMRAGCSSAVVKDRLAELFLIGRRTFERWGTGRVVPGEAACQGLIGEQIGRLFVSIERTEDLMEILDHLLKFEYRALLVHVHRLLPKFLLRTPRMRRYKKSVLELYDHIHASHTPGQREGERRDLVDDLMELHHADPQFMPETNLGFAFIAPMIAGHYLGSATAFSVYELLKQPRFREQIVAEADNLFAGGDPTAANLSPESIDAAHRFSMEVLRLHPVIPTHLRTTMNSFEVGNIEVPAYSELLVGYTATHYMEEFFPDPETFDIDRYLEPRDEHRQTGAYVPFGVGTHVCGGSGWTRLHMAANLLLMARHLDMELVPSNYRLKLSSFPKSSPAKSFKFRVKGHRHPLRPAQS